jgi:hypothetical protein
MAAAEADEERFDCGICWSDYPTAEIVSFECTHKLCHGCFTTQAKTKLAAGELMECVEVKCSGKKACPPELFADLLNEAEIKEYSMLYYQAEEAARAEEAKTKYGMILPTPDLVAKFAGYVAEQDRVMVATETDFFHYTCCGEKDGGWGCAYRCLQMILSNLLLASAAASLTFRSSPAPSPLVNVADSARWHEMPSLNEIQRRLAELGRIAESEIGSTRWIEPPDCAFFLRSFGFDTTELVYRGKNDKETQRFSELLCTHFASHRTPVMIDDSVKAYCLLGIKLSEDKAQVSHVLRFDPHVFIYPPGRSAWGTKGVEWMRLQDAVPRRTKWMVLFPCRSALAPDQRPPLSPLRADAQQQVTAAIVTAADAGAM